MSRLHWMGLRGYRLRVIRVAAASRRGAGLIALAICASACSADRAQQQIATGSSSRSLTSVLQHSALTHASPPAQPTQSPTEKPALGDAARVALSEATATCSFSWRRSLTDRLIETARYATPSYSARLRTVTDRDLGDWAAIQRDHQTGRCSPTAVFVVRSAPNTAAVQYVRVTLTQIVDTPPAGRVSGVFEATYELREQPDRSWLVDAEINGGG